MLRELKHPPSPVAPMLVGSLASGSACIDWASVRGHPKHTRKTYFLAAIEAIESGRSGRDSE